MEEKYDVAVYGLWYGNNYGSIITYYALTCVLEDMNFSYAMIRNPLGREIDIDSLNRSHPLRFAKEHYKITPLLPLNRLSELNDNFSAFLLGSDQMWNYYLSKPYRQSYFFDFVAEEKIKVAYATSFGIDKYLGPKEDKQITKYNLHRFNGISVRDDFSKRICEEDFEVSSEVLLDPVFLCSVEKYNELITEAENYHIDEDYIFAYILDPNPVIGANLQRIAEQTQKKVVVVFNQIGDKDNLKEQLNISSVYVTYEMDPTVNEWLYLYKNAQFVLTDSFHGTCFSIIFEKPFIVLKNNGRGGNRFPYLLGELGLLERMIENPEEFVTKFEESGLNTKIDYEKVKGILDDRKRTSLKWLKEALEGKYTFPSNVVTDYVSAKNCVGCSACAASCPKNAIRMEPDSYGYYVPSVDKSKCIDCGICKRICPVIKKPENTNHAPEVFAFKAEDKNVLFRSSSGGVFSLLAKEILDNGGAVYGVSWREDFTAAHIRIDKYLDIEKLRKSKYMQSYIGSELFRDVKEQLESERQVLFSGVPCQIAGLKKYLGKSYEKLYLVGLLCGNAPSAMFFQKYLRDDVPENLKEYEFRSKKEGWKSDCLTLTLTNGEKLFRHGAAQDEYQRLYHNHTMCPYHCEHCTYQLFPRQEDISIGDFWWLGKHDSDIKTEDGVSVVLVNNEKGNALFERIDEERIAVKKKVPVDWLNGNGGYKGNWAGEKRDLFYEKIVTASFHEAADYALKPNHGEYRSVYRKDNTVLMYDRKNSGFSFDRNVWEEHTVDGCLTLRVKSGQSEVGRYARMSLNRELKKGCRYVLSLRFKIRTISEVINFHIKDSGSSLYQLVSSRNIKGSNAGERWMDVEQEFAPQSGIFDEFMIGASQVKGTDNYISFAYIHIREL